MKDLFSTPKKAILTSVCILCGVLIIAAGAAFATSAVAKSKAIGSDVAELYALADAGIDPQNATIGDTEFGYHKGQFSYEVEFTSNGKNYKYLINSKTGEVISRYSDSGNGSEEKGLITLEDAKTIALNDAGLAEEDATFIKTEFDKQDNVYDIEFICGAMEYEYEIDAINGKILESSAEPAYVTDSDDGAVAPQPEYIGLARAKEIALDDAGVNAEDVTYKKAKLDKDDGKAVYDIEFVTKTKDYEYEIDAITGDIVNKDVESITGDASDNTNTTQYIGVDKAKEIALKDAGVAGSQAKFTKAKLDTDDGMKIYDIEFFAYSYEYEYEINAITGDIMDKSVEAVDQGGNDNDDNDDDNDNNNTADYIGVAKAKSIALKDAGVSQSQATFTKAELDEDDGVYYYDIEFHTTAKEYEYEINAKTGKIIDKSVESISNGGNGGSSDNVIGLTKAKSIALKDAGVLESQATFTKAKLDEDDGVLFYDIEFYTSTTEYEYEINAKTGKITDKSSETVSGHGNEHGQNNYIGVDKAKEIAVKHAGFTTSGVTFRKAKLEHDDGRDVYEIEFIKNGVDYEYVIDARTGAILEHESEHDDD